MAATSTGARVCVCVLFNHPFTANIPLLRSLYAGRFSHVRFLMPLERTAEADVLTVYRGSYAHHAYAGDQVEALGALDCTHYLMIHDDVVLAPWIDEGNILELLGIQGPGESYIGNLGAPPRDVGSWGYQLGSLWKMLHPRNNFSGTGVENLATVLAQLPPVDEAARRAAVYGIPAHTTFSRTADTMSPGQTLPLFPFTDKRDPGVERETVERLLDLLFMQTAPADLTIPYPIAYSGPATDLYLVPKPALTDFAHYGRVLAAAGLFVEMAGPTALMLSSDLVRTDRDSRIGTPYWALQGVSPEEVLDLYEGGAQTLAVHPVKLSRIADADAFIARMRELRSMRSGRLDHSDALAVTAGWPTFDAASYLEINSDVAKAGLSAFKHFLYHGRYEGRRWSNESLERT